VYSALQRAGPGAGGDPQVLRTPRFSQLWQDATSFCQVSYRATKWHQGRLALWLHRRAGQHHLTGHSSLLSVYPGNNWEEGLAKSSSILISLFITTCL